MSIEAMGEKLKNLKAKSKAARKAGNRDAALAFRRGAQRLQRRIVAAPQELLRISDGTDRSIAFGQRGKQTGSGRAEGLAGHWLGFLFYASKRLLYLIFYA